MKKSSLQTNSSKLLFACAALGVTLTSITASAQVLTLISDTVNDGGFESVGGDPTNIGTKKTFFVSPTSSTSNIPYWGATLVNAAGGTVAAPTDSGAENAPISTGADNYSTHSGVDGAFWQPNANSTAFNLVTTRTMVAGDVYNLSWYGRLTGPNGVQAATLFSQLTSTVGATYTYQPSATLVSLDATNVDNFLVANFSLYTLTYTATADDAGKYIGLTYGNSGGNYISADDFNLTVTPGAAVPEPSTYALLLACLGSVLFVRGFRGALV